MDEELYDEGTTDQNMYASIVNIYGRTQDVMKMFMNVVPSSFTKTHSLDLGIETVFNMKMTTKTPASSEIKISTKPDHVFFFLSQDNVYSPDIEVTITTDKSVGNGYIDGLILCYQGLASLDLVKHNMAEVHHVIVEDTIGMIVTLDKLDQLKDSFLKHKTMVDSKALQ